MTGVTVEVNVYMYLEIYSLCVTEIQITLNLCKENVKSSQIELMCEIYIEIIHY